MKNITLSVVLLRIIVIAVFLFEQTDLLKYITSNKPINNNGNAVATDSLGAEESQIAIWVLNLGEADCSLISIGEKHILIDAGEADESKTIVSLFEKNEIKKLDYLVITHFDKDHVGSAGDIITELQVDHVIQPDYIKESKAYDKYRTALANKRIEPEILKEKMVSRFNDTVLSVYPPDKDYYEKSNDYSLICDLQYRDKKFLFMGDAEEIRIAEFLDICNGNYIFIKIPHHGKISILSEELIRQVNPQYAVITCSEEEMPDERLLRFLKENNVPTFLSKDGDISLTYNGKGCSISQY